MDRPDHIWGIHVLTCMAALFVVGPTQIVMVAAPDQMVVRARASLYSPRGREFVVTGVDVHSTGGEASATVQPTPEGYVLSIAVTRGQAAGSTSGRVVVVTDVENCPRLEVPFVCHFGRKPDG